MLMYVRFVVVVVLFCFYHGFVVADNVPRRELINVSRSIALS